MTYPSKAQIVAEALTAERAHTARLTRQLADTGAEAEAADQYLDDVAHRLAQWVADGGVVDTGLLAEVLDDLLVARNILAVLRLRAVQS